RIELFHRKVQIGRDDDEHATITSLGSCDVTTSPEARAAPASCPLTVPKGPYGERDTLVVRASTVDHRGTTVASAYTLWPGGRQRPPPPPPRPASSEFAMWLERRSFEVGETAALRLRSPFRGPATAWVTVEREGVLASRQVTVTGP